MPHEKNQDIGFSGNVGEGRREKDGIATYQIF